MLNQVIYEQAACWAMAFAGHPKRVETRHPAAAWIAELLGELALEPARCPRSGEEGPLVDVLNHLLRHHEAGYAEAAAWLESCDPDLYALAVHYLAGKARAEAADRALVMASATQSGTPTPP